MLRTLSKRGTTLAFDWEGDPWIVTDMSPRVKADQGFN
jgi:hypothetical protein